MRRLIVLISLCVVLCHAASLNKFMFDNTTTFRNPIMDVPHADPWMIKIDGFYYLTATTGGSVKIWKSSDISNFHKAENKEAWRPAAGSHYTNIWAPELHDINGHLYVYFAAAMDDDNARHRLYVLRAESRDPLGNWKFVGQVKTHDDNWAIDGTVWNKDGTLYFIWSGWANSAQQKTQNLYIARMSSPTTLTGDRVMLLTATESWQKDGDFSILEGPEILVHNKRVFLVYSASSSWTSRYGLGFMGTDGGDPMNYNSWWRYNKPVMSTANGVYGPGHCSFTKDGAGDPWILYHANDTPNGGWGGRTVRAEPFGWNPDGSPAFPTPPRNTKEDVPKPKY